MMKRAFEGTDCESLSKHLEGTNALAISATDATAPARILAKYAKQFPALELIAGVVEGNYNDQAGIQALPRFRPEKNFLENFLEAFSLRSQTSLVCLTRLQRHRVETQQLLSKFVRDRFTMRRQRAEEFTVFV